MSEKERQNPSIGNTQIDILNRIAKIEERIARVEERLNANDINISDIKSRFDKLDERIDRIDNRVWYIVTGILVSIGLEIIMIIAKLI